MQTNSVQRSSLTWHSSALTHVGYVREINEDAYLDAREQGLWIVADGMGGHHAGDMASQMVVERLINFVPGDDLARNIDDIEDRLLGANRHCRKQSAGRRVMGTTAALLFAHEPFCFFLWVGDSRVYRLRDGTLTQVTEDHSLVQEMQTLGEISAAEAADHPSSNIITRAIGVREELFIDIEYSTIEPGDRFLLCSDGLYKDLSEGEITQQLRDLPVEQSTKNLVQLALDRGGNDNITAIVVQAEYA